jgi:hypothetical protein
VQTSKIHPSGSAIGEGGKRKKKKKKKTVAGEERLKNFGRYGDSARSRNGGATRRIDKKKKKIKRKNRES